MIMYNQMQEVIFNDSSTWVYNVIHENVSGSIHFDSF